MKSEFILFLLMQLQIIEFWKSFFLLLSLEKRRAIKFLIGWEVGIAAGNI